MHDKHLYIIYSVYILFNNISMNYLLITGAIQTYFFMWTVIYVTCSYFPFVFSSSINNDNDNMIT